MMKRAWMPPETDRASLSPKWIQQRPNLFQHDHHQLCGNSNVPNGLEINKHFSLSVPSPFQSFLSSFQSFRSFFSFLPSFFTNCCVCRRSNNTTAKTAGTNFCGRRISKHFRKPNWQTQKPTTAGGREVDERQPREEEEEEEMPFQISANHQP